MSAVQDAINELNAEVTRQTTAVASIKALIDGFIAATEEAKDDPEELAALLAGFKANTDALAAAVPANVPPVENPPVEEPPVENPPQA